MKDSIHYNQVSGKEMKAYFVNGDMRHIEVIGKAKKDPVFQEMLALAQELADLEEQILNTVSEEIPVGEPELPPVELSEADKKLIQQYKDLFSGSGSLEGMQVAK